jgi:hypothetical protein
MVMDAILDAVVHGHTEGKGLLTLTERLVEINNFLFNIKLITKPSDGGLIQTLPQRLPGVVCVRP